MSKITLKAARVNAGLRQTDAAKELGVSADTIGNWEKGKTTMDGKKLQRLCALYNVDIGDIILPEYFG